MSRTPDTPLQYLVVVGVAIGQDRPLMLSQYVAANRPHQTITRELPPSIAVRLRRFVQSCYVNSSPRHLRSQSLVDFLAGYTQEPGARKRLKYRGSFVHPNGIRSSHYYGVSDQGEAVVFGLGLGPNTLLSIQGPTAELSIVPADQLMIAHGGWHIFEISGVS